MHSFYLFSVVTVCFFCLQSCGINNYFKAKKLREEIVSENRKNEKLIKKREEEYAKLQLLKDSFQRQQQRMKGERP